MNLTYELTGSGWACCKIETVDSTASVTASYLGDALGDFANAVVNLLQGDKSARFSFDEEPGEFRWILERQAESISIRILEFKHLWGNEPDEEGTILLNTSVPFIEFLRAVNKMLQSVLEKYGTHGYKKKWVEHDFPLAQFETIQKHSAI
jgi:hypothetical protein